MHIVTVSVSNYDMVDKEFVYPSETFVYNCVGHPLVKDNIDGMLTEYLVKRLMGRYFPINFNVENESTSYGDGFMEGTVEISISIAKPQDLTSEEISNMYIGGVRMRQLDVWAYSIDQIQKSTYHKGEASDGTRFYFNAHRRASDEEKIVRAYRAIKALKPEWDNIEIKLDDTSGVYLAQSKCHSNLEISLRNYKLHKELIKIASEKEVEKFLLHRANSRNIHGGIVNHYSCYDPKYDSNLETALTEEQQRQIFNLIDKTKIKRGVIVCTRLRQEILVSQSESKTKISIPITDWIERLFRMPGINIYDIVDMYFRYQSFGDAGQQTSTPTIVARVMSKEFGVKYEGFASPINAQHQNFCSLFAEDKKFGGMGPFRANTVRDHQDGNWSINPPFTEHYYEYVRNTIEETFSCDIRQDILLFVKISKYDNDDSTDWLMGVINNPYLVDFAILENGDYTFERISKNLLHQMYRGTLWGVYSPMGKEHPFNSSGGMKKLLLAMKSTVPSYVKAVQDKVKCVEKPKFVNYYSLEPYIKEGGCIKDVDLGYKVTNQQIEDIYEKLGINSCTVCNEFRCGINCDELPKPDRCISNRISKGPIEKNCETVQLKRYKSPTKVACEMPIDHKITRYDMRKSPSVSCSTYKSPCKTACQSPAKVSCKTACGTPSYGVKTSADIVKECGPIKEVVTEIVGVRVNYKGEEVLIERSSCETEYEAKQRLFEKSRQRSPSIVANSLESNPYVIDTLSNEKKQELVKEVEALPPKEQSVVKKNMLTNILNSIPSLVSEKKDVDGEDLLI